jgi:NitT/TauT family transport system ATP-binding protein
VAMKPHEYRQNVLRIEDVHVTKGDNVILRGVNATIRNVVRPGLTQGQVVALLGPSGIGKTTLFRIMAGLEAPDRGRVLLGEAGAPVRAGLVGVVAQQYPLFAHRTVRGNMAVADRSRQGGPKADDMLQLLGLQEHASKYPSQLSGGQRQRAAIAQQFMCSEHYLLMDEPFSGLDLLAVRSVVSLICKLASQDELKTIIVVTHDIQAALLVADTLWVMGREHDSSGAVIPGAKIVAEYNLIERGLAWQENMASLPEFAGMLAEIHSLFPKL